MVTTSSFYLREILFQVTRGFMYYNQPITIIKVCYVLSNGYKLNFLQGI